MLAVAEQAYFAPLMLEKHAVNEACLHAADEEEAAENDAEEEEEGTEDAAAAREERRGSHAEAGPNEAGAAGGKPAAFFAQTPDGTRFAAGSFADLHLSRPLLRACSALGYGAPTPIQVPAPVLASTNSSTQCLLAQPVSNGPNNSGSFGHRIFMASNELRSYCAC
jgi:hypothetical protein